MTHGEEEIAFYYELGKTLTSWGRIEEIMRNLSVGFVPIEMNRNALSLGFFSLEGARARREFTEAVVSRLLPDLGANLAMRKDWEDLIDRARRAANSRNKLAHWNVFIFPKSRPGRRYCLASSIIRKKRVPANKDLPRTGSLCLRDLYKMRLEFITLGNALENYLHRLAKKPEPFPRSDEQPGSPLPTAKLRLQILEALARLIQPSAEKP